MTATGPVSPPVRARRPGRRAALAAVAVVVVLAAAVTVWLVGRDSTPAGAPYVDKASVAGLTLCRDGKAVTEGSTTDQPFADAVVSGQAATGGYAVGTTATLYAYQPRVGVDPSTWNGAQLAGTTVAADSAAPAVVQSRTATTLAQFASGYPLSDGGWVQLRVVLGAPGQSPQTASYATADLHVSGTHWTLAYPGHGACPR